MAAWPGASSAPRGRTLRAAHFKGVLNLHEFCKLWHLRMKSWPILSYFGGIPLNAPDSSYAQLR